jgi:hypothetical protein
MVRMGSRSEACSSSLVAFASCSASQTLFKFPHTPLCVPHRTAHSPLPAISALCVC